MITLDISGDFNIFDNLEVITVKNPHENAILIDNVRRNSAILGTDMGGSSLVYGSAIEFQIWKNCAPVDFVPKLNGRITDQFDKHYRIDSIEDMAWRTKWSVKATSEASEGVN